MGAEDASLRERLEHFLASRLRDAGAVRVTALTRSTEGFSQETFSCDVEVRRDGAAEQRGYIVKREPVAGLREPCDLEPEFRVLHALANAPLPREPADDAALRPEERQTRARGDRTDRHLTVVGLPSRWRGDSATHGPSPRVTEVDDADLSNDVVHLVVDFALPSYVL